MGAQHFRGRGARLTAALLLASLCASCATSRLYDHARSQGPGTMSLPKDSDALDVRSYPARAEDRAVVEFAWNWPLLVIGLPFTLAWDAVTLPVQWALGFPPYG